MKSKFTWFGIMVFGATLLGMPAVYAADVQPEPADSAYQEAMDDHIAGLEEIAANREAVIEELVQMWFMDIPGWETEFRSLLNVANDSKLLAILNAESYAEAQAILGGGTPAFYSADSMADPFALGDTDKDFVYTPVKPCRIVDTREVGGKIPSGGSRGFYVYGSGAQMSAQGGNPAGCTSPRGEPRAVHMNIVAVNSEASGFLTVWPIGTSRPLAGILNYFPGSTDPVSNAFTVKTTFAMGLDIGVYAHKTTHVVADVMGYYHEVDQDDFKVTWVVPEQVKLTNTSHNGNFGGYPAMNSWIQSHGCPGYHVCDYTEVSRWMQMKGTSVFTENSWINSPGVFYGAGTGNVGDCRGWLSIANYDVGTIIARSAGKVFPGRHYCYSSFKVACCK